MNELTNDIKSRVKAFGSQAAYAEFLGLSDAMISAVINGKKRPTKAILDDLGYSKVKVIKYVYTKK